ncbi:MAG: DinB family protein [Bryobacteraceae bacterium]|jgi:uncharacterized damage-inducible protein DinB
MASDFVRENQASRHELQALTASLSDEGFARDLGNGWTVSTVLCHLAFWDRLVLRRVREWQRSGFEAVRLAPPAVDSINEAAREISRAVPGREAARIALESAEEIDAQVERLSSELIDQINAGGFERVLRRSLHRREHLRRIREALGAV